MPRQSGVRQAIRSAGNVVTFLAGRGGIRLSGVAYTEFTELRYTCEIRKAYPRPILGYADKARLRLAWAKVPGDQQGSGRCGSWEAANWT